MTRACIHISRSFFHPSSLFGRSLSSHQSKMFKISILALALTVAYASTEAEWQVFKHKHNKSYNGDEEVIRRYIWKSNMRKVQEHNELFAQGKKSYYLAENEYADMTNEEFNKKMNGLRLSRPLEIPKYVSGQYKSFLPSSVDWRDKGYVTPVKNQGQCGSCWAFSTTGSLEGQHFKSKGKLVSLSESNLVDCSQRWGNQGCNGGLMDQAFQYVIDNKGIDTEDSYPYQAEQRTCAFKKGNVGSTEVSYKDVQAGSEDELQKAVAEVGPISVAIDASHTSFQLYGGGVYDEPACSSTALDHGVLAVGYGTQNGGTDYWIVKNSWGGSWGQKGYILMSRNKDNQCGIASMASYPKV